MLVTEIELTGATLKVFETILPDGLMLSLPEKKSLPLASTETHPNNAVIAMVSIVMTNVDLIILMIYCIELKTFISVSFFIRETPLSDSYQIMTRSLSGRNIGSPSTMPNASKNGAMLRSDTLTRLIPNEWGSPVVRDLISSGRILLAQRFA